jgi:hypothetical protein
LKARDRVNITMTVAEVELLFRAALDNDDLERADQWAGVILRQNDRDEPEPSKASR